MKRQHKTMSKALRRPIAPMGFFLAAIALAGCGSKEAVDSRPITPSLELNRSRAPIGSPVELTYRFEVGTDSAPISKDYQVFVHFLDSHDALLFTDDHFPPQPTSSWTAGSTIDYDRTLWIPLYPYLGNVNIVAGLYLPEGGERLGMLGVEDGNQAYQVGQIQLLDQKENIFLVYKEGWHQPESLPENPNVEWQWTKKEAVCSFRNPKKDGILYLETDSNIAAFEEPLQVAIRIGDNEVASFDVNERNPVLRKIPVPANALGNEDWVDLRIVNSQSFVPAEKGIGSDSRELGVRVYHLYLDTFSGT